MNSSSESALIHVIPGSIAPESRRQRSAMSTSDATNSAAPASHGTPPGNVPTACPYAQSTAKKAIAAQTIFVRAMPEWSLRILGNEVGVGLSFPSNFAFQR